MVNPDEMAAEVEGRVERALAQAMRAAADRYEAEDVLAMPEAFKGDLMQVLGGVWLYAVTRGGEEIVGQFKDYGFAHLETKQDERTLFERIRDAFIEQYGSAKVTRIFETTRRQLQQIILDGTRQGLGIEAIAKDMRQSIPELSRIRAHTIARTETHSASRYATQEVAKTSRRPLTKTWVSTEDARTRDFGEGDGVMDSHNHRVMNDVTVPMNMPYMVPTQFGTREPLMFPGDPNGSAGNIINCRCGEFYKRAEL